MASAPAAPPKVSLGAQAAKIREMATIKEKIFMMIAEFFCFIITNLTLLSV